MANDVRFQRILVADDDEGLRGLVRSVLWGAGYEVLLARDGLEAIELVEAQRPNLVVLGVVMPIVTGWGVLAHFRELPSPPAVVLCAASRDRGSFARGIREGVSGFIFKPFRLDEPVLASDRILRGGRLPRLTWEERRNEPRRSVTVDLGSLTGGRSDATMGSLVDLSPSGVQLERADPLGPGERLRMGFHIPTGELSLDLEARVQWSGPGFRGFASGLAFENLGATDQHALRDLLAAPRAPRQAPRST